MMSTPSVRTDGPLSLAQQRLWFLDRFERNPGAHQVSWSLRFRGPLNPARLRAALESVVARHEILRTSFPEVDGRAVARVESPAPLAWSELEGSPEPLSEAFDLTTGPLYRARLFRLSSDEHVLVWTAHRIIFDEASLLVLLEELAAAWNSTTLSETVSFAPFVQSESDQLATPDFAAHLAWWKEQFALPLPVLQLPTDRPRPAVQQLAAEQRSITLGKNTIAAVRKMAESEAASAETILLTAFATLLQRHTAQAEVTVGRPVKGEAKLIGPTTTTEVLRLALKSTTSFRDTLEATIATEQATQSHAGIPLESIVEALQPERNLSYHPVFQTAFEFSSALPQDVAFEESVRLDVDASVATTPCDLALLVEDRGETWKATVTFQSALFDASTIERLLGHFATLLAGACADPSVSIAQLPLLTPAERQQLLVDWNATTADPGSTLSLQQRFEQQTALTPDGVAVIFGEESLTYAELNRRANCLAHYLIAAGIGVEMRVGLSMHRSFEMLVAVLGILKAGAGYVPLDPAVPAERLSYMIEDAQLALLVTQERFVETLTPHGVPLFILDAADLSAQPGTNPAAAAPANSLVYITYTSGSTGKPKGILMTQDPLRHLLGWMLRTTHLPSQARTLQFASLSFDVSFQDIFSTWFSGGTLVLITEAQRQDLAGLPGLIDRHAVHRIFLPAVALQQLAEGFCSGQYACAHLRKVISGSEQLMVTEAVREMFTTLSECRLHNEYGPSETHVVTELKMPDNPAEWVRRPAIGRPIDNSQIYLLDRTGQPVPIGVLGELHIGGAGLARGYLGRAELTAEKFLPDPFSSIPGGRMYRTGDQARWLANGDIEFIGRLDHQIKIRGYRVEPGDIEAALEKHAQVREACVLAREFGPGDKRLVAYLGVDLAAAPGVSDLRGFLAAKLPEYMIPSAFVFLAGLPLNANGKVDRPKLPAPESARPELAAAFLAPQNELEQFLAAQWREMLHLDQVGIRDNFFDLGGNSVMIVQIHHRVKQHLGRDFPLIALFQYPTIDTLAQFLGAGSARPTTAGTSVADRAAKQRAAMAARRRPLASNR